MAGATDVPGLSVHDAVRTAASHLQELYPHAQDILLEEVELSDDDRYWSVTLSFTEELSGAARPGKVMAHMGGRHSKYYKIIKIDRATGKVRSVKIRELHYV